VTHRPEQSDYQRILVTKEGERPKCRASDVVRQVQAAGRKAPPERSLLR
jgi:hypothetical protein